jgi:hypothetical protein
MALALVFQVASSCLCPPIARACATEGCCPRSASAHHHQGPAPGYSVAPSAPECCPSAQPASPVQARLQDRTAAPEAAVAGAATYAVPGAEALPQTPDLVSLLTIHTSSPPALILRI